MNARVKAVILGAGCVLALALPAASVAAVQAEPDAARLSSQYAAWAGGKANADALVSGLSNGSSVTLVTLGPDKSRSLAGFTPQARMSPAEIAAALAQAKSTLASLGIRQPSADQIQAALIGGEVTLPNGRTRMVQGPVALLGAPAVSPVAAR